MAQRFYPAVLERGSRATFGVWFPDFPGCVAAARSQEEAMAKAQGALAQAVVARTEEDIALPAPTAFERIVLPKGCDFVSFFAVGVEPPNPSERVNIYLPKALLTRIDARAEALGMSRSSFFGLAANWVLDSLEAGYLGRAGLAALKAAAGKPSTSVRTRQGKP